MKITLSPSGHESSTVFYGGIGFSDLEVFIVRLSMHPKKIFILVDENTREHCLPVLLLNTPSLKFAEILEIPAGEKSKTLEMASQLWTRMLAKQADRSSLLICLGGGVVTDLGGFVAALFMRGIPFIHIPTSLMGMVDAAVGGKTAVNFKQIKNQVGSFSAPLAVFVFPLFLQTLGEQGFHDGFSEIVKYGLIADTGLWKKITSLVNNGFHLTPQNETRWESLICICLAIKCEIVNQDYREENLRRILNFGHTVGHALEAFSMHHDPVPISHGTAVAAGIICEGRLSVMLAGLAEKDQEKITKFILKTNGHYTFNPGDIPAIMELMLYDKKNRNSALQITLLSEIGKAMPGQGCSWKQVEEALLYFCNLD